MYFVYVLKSLKDGKHYIGFSNDLKRRLEEHNSGLVKSTINRKPMELIYTVIKQHKLTNLSAPQITAFLT